MKTNQQWTSEALLELGQNYRDAAVFLAAAELNLFAALKGPAPLAAAKVAKKLQCDQRGVTALLDALTAIGLVKKQAGRYALASGAEALLTPESPRTILAMAQHQANCLRNWAQLAMVVKSGKPAPKIPSVRGAEGDAESFISGMHNISAPFADEVIRAIKPLKFTELLDLGGASGTWTMAFLRACPGSRAFLFDLPHVIPMAKRRIKDSQMVERVRLVAGDFMRDPLPAGADLVWVSAIVHQNSRAQNRQLFASVFRALAPGGRIAIRDIVMELGHTQPVMGALFAINMLVATEGGGTFTLEELREDLASAGFAGVSLARKDPGMNAVVVATKG